ncbi:pentapeptide repeat-containing protein [Nocardia asteroides]|uniref:pentapeptide repeat-containing protein n=1 Tax=Nocardia asteroides TaxID=1824 RepID=UPI00365A9361
MLRAARLRGARLRTARLQAARLRAARLQGAPVRGRRRVRRYGASWGCLGRMPRWLGRSLSRCGWAGWIAGGRRVGGGVVGGWVRDGAG